MSTEGNESRKCTTKSIIIKAEKRGDQASKKKVNKKEKIKRKKRKKKEKKK